MRMTRSPISFSDAERKWLEENRMMVAGDYHRAFCAEFDRSDVTKNNLKDLRRRMNWKTGRSGWFAPGRTHQAKLPIGSLQDNGKGYLRRKMHHGDGEGPKWRGLHIVNWEAVNGPLPKGHCLKCRDGNRKNVDPSNWVLIPFGVRIILNKPYRMRRPTYSAAPDELKPAILALAQIEHRIWKRSK